MLHRYVVKAKPNNADVNLKRVGYYGGRQTFSEEQDTVLADYLKQGSDI